MYTILFHCFIQPLELNHVYNQVKAKLVAVSKDKLADVLDHLVGVEQGALYKCV